VQRNLGDITLDLEAARLAEGRQVVDGILDAEPNRLDASFRQAFHRQTGGHPLFIVELLEDLKKEGTLVQDEAGQWVIGAELDWLSLPTRVEGAIAGRMAHLSKEQRWLLTIASVMGEHFLAEVVDHVAPARR
jgi:predicted ATPase